MDQKKIGSFIAEKRKTKGYTQRDLSKRLNLSEKTISKWECGNGLPEVSIMLPLCDLLEINVNELLLEENCDINDKFKKMGDAMTDLVKQLEFEKLKNRIFKQYGIEIDSAETSKFGAGLITYFVHSENKKYVVKYYSENGMNHPENEPDVCKFLFEKGIPVCRFLKNKQGKEISTDESGRRYNVQRFLKVTPMITTKLPSGL